MSALPPEIQEIIDLYDQLEATGWEWNSSDLYNVPILAHDFDAFKDVDHAFEVPLNNLHPWYTNFPVASHVESSTDMYSLSTMHPTVQEQCYPMHMAALGPESDVETSPWSLVGSNDPRMNMEAIGYQETWDYESKIASASSHFSMYTQSPLCRPQHRGGFIHSSHPNGCRSRRRREARYHPYRYAIQENENCSVGGNLSNGFPANNSKTHLSQSQAMQWNSTSITLTENVAVEQLGRSPHGSSATHHLNHPSSVAMELWASTPSTTVPNQRSEPHRRKVPPVGTKYFEAALLHVDGQCNHVNSTGVRCKITAKKSTKKKDSDKNKKIANHWLNCHAVAEVIKVHKKTLDLDKCTILKSAEMVSIAEEYCLRCPVNGCGCEFVDISSFKRHIQNDIAPHERERSDAEANVVVASVKPRRLRPSNDFNNGTEEAVWRLLEARRRIVHN